MTINFNHGDPSVVEYQRTYDLYIFALYDGAFDGEIGNPTHRQSH